VLKFGTQTTVYVGPHFEVRGGVRHRYVFANGTRIALLTPLPFGVSGVANNGDLLNVVR